MELLVVLLIWFLLALWGYKINEKNGRSTVWGVIIGLIFGLIGIVILYIAGKTELQKAKDFKRMKELLKD